MWNDKNFKALSPLPPSGQGLWIYLLIGPQTGLIPGLFCTGHAALAEALGWSLEDFEKAFSEVFAKGMVKDSREDRLVWVPNAIKYNPPASPNVVKSWASALDDLPECTLLKEAIEAIRTEVYSLDKKENKGFAKAFREVFGEGIENPSPNQEQEQEQDNINTASQAPLDEKGARKRELPKEATRLSSLLFELHRDGTDSGFKVSAAQLSNWARDIEKLNRIDGRDWLDIETVMRWAKTPGGFWAPHIISGKKLRDKFPTLLAQMKRPAGSPSKILNQDSILEMEG